MRLRNISKTKNVADLIKTILKSPHQGLLHISNLTAPARPVLLLGPLSFKHFLAFNMLELLLYFKKNYAITFFRSLAIVSQISGPPSTEKQPFKKFEYLSFQAPFVSKIKISFCISQIFRLPFIISENLTYIGQLILKL